MDWLEGLERYALQYDGDGQGVKSLRRTGDGPWVRYEDVRSAPRGADPAQAAIQAIDGICAHLQESGLAEEAGGLALYGHIKAIAEARAGLAATLSEAAEA